jgi:hypothetical protein
MMTTHYMRLFHNRSKPAVYRQEDLSMDDVEASLRSTTIILAFCTEQYETSS